MRDRPGKPSPNHRLEWPGGVVPEWARPKGNPNKPRFGKGKRREREGGSSPGKRERLQKVMAQSGHGSRRNIEILIAQGHVTINGQVAKLGDSVGPGDKVRLDGEILRLRFGEALPRVLLYHKPEGEIVSRDDPEGRATVFEKLPRVPGGRWVSVGRLDLNTGGLLIFTTNGELANRLTHPRFEVEREYAVRILGELSDEQKKQLLETGVDIDGENCKFDSLEERGGDGANRWYHVILREGKNREVRRMIEAVGLTVSRLMRVRFGPVQLPGFLKRGMMREMPEADVQQLLTFAGIGGAAEPKDEEDDDEALENIGNVARPGEREPARAYHDDEDEIDGNRDNIGNVAPPVREPDGNRPRGPVREADGNRPRGPRRPGQKPPFFGKKRGPGQGGQGQGQGQGQPHQHHKKQHAKRPHGQGQGQGQPPMPGQGPAPGQGQGGGQDKPRGNRRNKNRNRNRDAAPQGELQPVSNANRDPY